MKISELIEYLEQQKDIYGDLVVNNISGEIDDTSIVVYDKDGCFPTISKREPYEVYIY